MDALIIALKNAVRVPIVYCPKGILCGRRLKTRVRKSGVRPCPFGFLDRFFNKQLAREHIF